MNRFNGKHVVVTGGTSGIGLAVAKAFIDEGATVLVTGRDAGGMERAAALLGEKAIVIRNDAGAMADARALASKVSELGLRLDAVFINAGVAKFGALADVDEALWDLSFNTNVKGAYFQLQALAPLLNKGASIVLNGSINAHIGMPGSSVYAATKAALISFARTLSAELLPQGARVNVVSPGPIETPLYGKLGMDEAAQKEMAAGVLSQVPAGRFGHVDEVAATVLHLASPESAFIVGTEIIIDGGMSQL